MQCRVGRCFLLSEATELVAAKADLVDRLLEILPVLLAVTGLRLAVDRSGLGKSQQRLRDALGTSVQRIQLQGLVS